MTERAQNADFRRKPQIFADSPLLLEIQAFGGRRKPQKTADFCRKPQETADWAPCRLRCVTLSSALVAALLEVEAASGSITHEIDAACSGVHRGVLVGASSKNNTQ